VFHEFHKPATAAEAVELRRRYPTSLYLAGGAEVNSRGGHARCAPGVQVDRTISIAHLPLGGVHATGYGVFLGAGTAIQDLIENPEVPPLLAQAAGQFANRNIRNVATLGGNLAINRSCSNLIPSLLALEARVTVLLPEGEKAIPIEDYVAGHDPAGLILSVGLPRQRLTAPWATRKHSRTVNDLSIVSVAVVHEGSRDVLRRVAVAVGGVAPTAIRLHDLEQRLEGEALPDREAIEGWVKSMIHPIDDVRGSAAYKSQVAAAMVGWALHHAAAGRGDKA
jgi:probable selenate reductase FAD-binding subunit